MSVACSTEGVLDLAGNHEGTITTASATAAATATMTIEAAGSKRTNEAPDDAEKPPLIPIPVLAAELTDVRVQLRDAWVGELREKRDISRVMKIASVVLPAVSHLKRCSGNRLILGFAAIDETSTTRQPNQCYTRQELEDLLTRSGLEMSMFRDSRLEIVAIPASTPRTKAQACAASKFWPVNFHPDPSVELMLSGDWFAREDLRRIQVCADACAEASRREARGNDECDGSAVVFDPATSRILAVAAARIDRHPMWHAAMLAVDLVARLAGEGAGAYDLVGPDDESTEENTDNIDNGSSSDSGLPPRKRKHSINRDVRSLAYPSVLIDIVDRYASRLSHGAATSTTISETKGGGGGGGGYLCTDYWIFLEREPCPLCAMALLHSRASNVFYSVANERRGVLGSRALLHATPGLNHRYRVWRCVVGEPQCPATARPTVPPVAVLTSRLVSS